MKTRRLVLMVLISFLVLSGISSVRIRSDSVIEFVIHKRMYVDPNANPDFKVNDGLRKELEEDTFGFDGAEFTVFELSSYLELLGLSYEESISKMMNLNNEDLINILNLEGDYVDTVTTSMIDNESGVAHLRVNQTEEMNRVFVFIETFTPKYLDTYEVIHKAVPMFVVTPVEHPVNSGTYLSTIHLYPKNYGYKEEIKPPDVIDPEVPNTIPDLPGTGISSEVPYMAIGFIGFGLVVLVISKKIKEKYNEKENI